MPANRRACCSAWLDGLLLLIFDVRWHDFLALGGRTLVVLSAFAFAAAAAAAADTAAAIVAAPLHEAHAAVEQPVAVVLAAALERIVHRREPAHRYQEQRRHAQQAHLAPTQEAPVPAA